VNPPILTSRTMNARKQLNTRSSTRCSNIGHVVSSIR
jgi:hypothetical protein